MLRAALLAILALTTMPRPGVGQFGGMVHDMGGPRGPARAVEVEAAGGGRLTGPLGNLGRIEIDGDFGRYQIDPGKVRTIRLTPEENRLTYAGGDGVPIPGVVVTTSGEEIAGVLVIPPHWILTTEIGTLTLDPTKLKSITFLPDAEPEPEAEPDQAAGAVGHGPDTQAGRPQVLRLNEQLWAISPSGDRVAVRDTVTGKTATLELPASAEAPLSVTPVSSGGIAALHLEGETITRIAALSAGDGSWHPQDLREPASGRASPVVGHMTAAYSLGRYVYAFGAEANRWDVLELPEGVTPRSIVGHGSVVVEYDGHVHTFRAGTGRWEHVDADDLLGEDEPQG